MNFEGKQQSLLTFRVGPVLCCAPSLAVRSIITPPKMTQVPGSDPSTPGIFKHGSHIVKVIDLRQKFGVEQSEQTQPGNLIITIFEKESFAFWVDQILDVFDFPSTGWGNLPAAIPRGVFSRTLLLNKKIHLYSEFEKLATINDLGYLKHYINLLKEQQSPQEEKKNTLENNDKKEAKEIISPPPVESEKASTIKGDTPKKEDETLSVSEKSSYALKTESAQIKKPVPERIKEPLKTSITKNNELTKPIPAIKPASQKDETIKPQKISANHIDIVDKKNIEQKNEAFILKSNTSDESDSSSLGLIILFILILLSLGGGIYYVFINTLSNTYKPTQTKPALYKEQDINHNPYPEIELIEEPLSIQDNVYIQKSEIKDIPVINETDNFNHESNAASENLLTTNNTPSIPELKENSTISSSIKEKEAEVTIYQADIIQQDNDITITLVQSSEKKEPQIEETEIIPQQIESDAISEELLEAPAVETLKKEELRKTIKPKQVIKEIVHVVVKGDTLWAIAKKYVHNPFLYPELARLSNIKNPHRIYPGNRVKIRFIKD